MLAALRADPLGSGVFTDFDGTLAEVVLDPDAAVPVSGAVEVIETLASRYARVGVLSGRPVDFLARFFRPGPVVLSGLYGLEAVRDGVRSEHGDAARWRDVIDDTVALARLSARSDAPGSLPHDVRLEPKGLSLTVHYRGHPEHRQLIEEWVRVQARREGLEVRPARQSVEMHPLIEADKGTVLAELAAGLRHVCFLGDDVGDLPAFAALDALRAQGVTTVKVAIDGEETPPEVLVAADVAVAGPDEALDLLRSLL